MDLSKGHIRALLEGDLSSPKGIEACINASEALLQCINVALRPGELTHSRPSKAALNQCCGQHSAMFFSVGRSNSPLLSKNVVDLSPLLGHDKLAAVKQQRELFSELRDKFARRLTNHLNNVFIHQVTCHKHC